MKRIDVRAIRENLAMSQPEFATRFGIELPTLRQWEQGRRDPQGPARTLLLLIQRTPFTLLHHLDPSVSR